MVSLYHFLFYVYRRMLYNEKLQHKMLTGTYFWRVSHLLNIKLKKYAVNVRDLNVRILASADIRIFLYPDFRLSDRDKIVPFSNAQKS